MFEIKGILEFDPINVTKKHFSQSSWKKTVMVRFDDDLCSYYSWFIQKRFNLKLNRPLRGTHMTIVNDRITDIDSYIEAKKLFDKKEITIKYDPTIIRGNKKGHWWLKSDSNDASNIRRVMGLNPDPYFGYHMTIGIANELNLIHSNYIIDQCIRFNI
jgi:hypothetical protein